MKLRHLAPVFLFCSILSCKKSTSSDNNPAPPVSGDSARLTVVNGYGSGTYKIGDTVHIWANALAANAVFDTWTGYSALLRNAGEWHNEFVMPAQNLTLTGNTKSFTSVALKNEQIKGAQILKNVYYNFPQNHKGTVFLLHGTNGSAANITQDPEWIVMINDLAANGYAVVITEAEEVSLKQDTNKDGVLRWAAFPQDSVSNVDYANIKALRDTFYARGYTQRSLPLFSIGMSNGGAFSNALSDLFKFKTGVSYCAQGYTLLCRTSVTPLQFCMAAHDNNSEVGLAGDATALSNSQLLTSRGVCSKYFANDRSPVYPERFARVPGVTVATSTALYNELKANHWIDDHHFMTAVSDTITADVKVHAGNYPVYKSLSLYQQYYVGNQVDAVYAAHQFYSDLDKTTIYFLDHQCQ